MIMDDGRPHEKIHGQNEIMALAVIAGLMISLAPTNASAQTTEERFHDLFVTAGYCTAFGAAVGTAFLAWTEDPSENLEYVAMGASLGFLGGSVLGSYIIFSPTFADADKKDQGTLITSGSLPEEGLVLRPAWDHKKGKLASVEGGMTLFSF